MKPTAPPVRPPLPALTAMEQWYLTCLDTLSKHLKRAPTVHELAAYCGRSKSPVFDAMQSLKHKRRVRQNKQKRFEVVT
jgi:DNA-binding IclR family transcriptional regulator